MNDATKYIDAELERLVLGGLLHGGAETEELLSELSVDDFAVEPHREIFRSIASIAPKVGLRVDAVGQDLEQRGKREAAGGFTLLMDLHREGEGFPVTHLVKGLRRKAIFRRAVQLSRQINRDLEMHGSLNGNAPAVGAWARQLAELVEGSEGAHRAIRSIADVPAIGDINAAGISYLIEPELPMAAVIALTGASGSGKSTLATAGVRVAIDAGHPALVLDRENPHRIVVDRRNRLGFGDSPLLTWWGGWLSEEAPGPDSQIVLDWVRMIQPKPVVVIDSVVAFFGGESENDAAAMRKFMNGPRHLADLGAAVVLIHHDGKADSARDFRGSSDFKAAVDVAFHVSNSNPDGKLESLRLRSFKSRFGFSGDLIYQYAGGRMVRGDASDTAVQAVTDQLTALLRQNPGIRTKEFEDKAAKQGLGRNRARNFLINGILGSLIRRESASRNQFRHYLAEDRK